MASFRKLMIGVGLMAFLWCRGGTPAGAAGPMNVAMIMLDAFRPDYITMYDTPNIKTLIQTGTWVAEAKDVFPTNTTPNQVAFVTGTVPLVTGIPNNRYYDRFNDRIVGSPRDIKVPTIVDIARSSGISTAVVNHFPVMGRADSNIGPNASADDAARIIRDKHPQLLVYYYPNTDSTGHSYGPYSSEMREEVSMADKAIGTIIDAYKAAGLYERTVFILASDHWMSSNAAPAIPVSVPQALKAAGYKVSDATTASGIQPDTNIVMLQIGSTFLYLRDPLKLKAMQEFMTAKSPTFPPMAEKEIVRSLITPGPDQYTRLLQALADLQDVRIFGRDELLSMGCDPTALGDVVVSPEPGMLMLPSSGKGGIHGRPQESQTLLLFSGTPLNGPAVVQSGSITDVTPTALSLLGLPPAQTCTGKVLALGMK